jgi:hypothetical protein
LPSFPLSSHIWYLTSSSFSREEDWRLEREGKTRQQLLVLLLFHTRVFFPSLLFFARPSHFLLYLLFWT